MESDRRIFRDSSAKLFVGLWFGVGVLLLLIAFTVIIVRGEPIRYTNRNTGEVAYITGFARLWIYPPLLAAEALGVVHVLIWLNATVETTSTEIVRRDFLGRVVFRARWEHLRSSSRRLLNGERLGLLTDESKMECMPSPRTKWELVEVIQEMAPQVDLSPWGL